MSDFNFVGFSDAPTPETEFIQANGKLSALEPFFVMSHDRAGDIADYNPPPTGSDTLKHLKLYVGVPQSVSDTTGPILNLDSYDLYNACDQSSILPSGNLIVAGTGNVGGKGGPIKGAPIRFQKIHFYAAPANGQTGIREYFAHLPISSPVLSFLGGTENQENAFSTEASWMNRDYIVEQNPLLDTTAKFNDRLIISSGPKFSTNVWINGVFFEFSPDEINNIARGFAKYVVCDLSTNIASLSSYRPTNMPPNQRIYQVSQIVGDLICF